MEKLIPRLSKQSIHRLLDIVCDGAMLAFVFFLSFYLRFDLTISQEYFDLFIKFVFPIVAVELVIFYIIGLYRKIWQHANMRDFQTILLGGLFCIMAVTIIVLVIYNDPFPRSVILINGLLVIAAIGGRRFAQGSFYGWRIRRIGFKKKRPVLIIGAGETGSAILREMNLRGDLPYEPVGVVDDDPLKIGRYIYGVKIIGSRRHLRSLIAKYYVEEVIICMPNASREVFRDIYLQCQEANVLCKTLPGVYQLIDGTVKTELIREIRIEDILGRDPVKIDFEKLGGEITGQTIMVTGAGGSIGSELCRQISRLKPSLLVMVDQNEFNLFQIEQELLVRHNNTSSIAVIANILNKKGMKALFDKYKPNIVYHAAAYKHVPMMERHLPEAIENNLLGTKVVAEAAIQAGTERFVSISTDKAVEPVSVMGISKALSETLIQYYAQQDKTKFMIVRFGNVFDSSGSVVPIFKQQIAKGGPVTVTHPEMTRYFMTIPEAVQLVIQASGAGIGGEIFVLDMGKPVSILELARTMIKLSGFEAEVDIPIEFSNIRPGERLHEKLFWDNEEVIPSLHDKILLARQKGIDVNEFWSDLSKLEEAFASNESDSIQEIVYRMCEHSFGKAPDLRGIVTQK